MNRSVRNGLAIAGMAGGIFFLGQAVASADQTAGAGNGVDQSNSSTESDGGGLNGNLSSAEAKNVDVVEVDTDIDGGDGGNNYATINTGIVPNNNLQATTLEEPPGGPKDEGVDVDFHSGDVSLTQEANGGDVNHSGNVAVADTGNQTATATNNVDQSNTSQGDEHHSDWPGRGGDENGPNSLSPVMGGGGDEGGNANLNGSEAEATNIHKVEVDTDIDGGDGGTNNADINTGIIGNTFYCPEYSTCTYNFTTGDVTVYQSANGGSVNGSGNVSVGNVQPVANPCTCPQKHQEASPAVQPVAHVAPVAKAPVSASAQPSGQLAFTGSDVSLPLTVGLIALAAGIGLTAAGRRRETQTV
jgi:hypothetical protein